MDPKKTRSVQARYVVEKKSYMYKLEKPGLKKKPIVNITLSLKNYMYQLKCFGENSYMYKSKKPLLKEGPFVNISA
jgi:hypothetical protein